MNTKINQQKIVKVGWGLGLCNQNCIHCYNSSSQSNNVPRYTFDELKYVADKICPHISDINFGTGELLVNPNAKELLEYIKSTYPNVKLSVTSNGYSIVVMQDKEIKRFFHDVDISIDFPDKDKHNSFRRHPLAWAWATEALEKLSRLGVERTITTCVNSLTTNEDIAGLLDMAKHYGAYLRINWFRKVGRGKEELRLTPERAWEVINFMSDKVIFYSLDSIFAGPLGVDFGSKCPACKSSMRIHQDMSITPAPYLKGHDWSAGNILKDKISLNDIYFSKVFKKIRARKVSFCQTCKYYKICGSGCVTRAVLHNGGISKADDFCPVIAKIPDKYIHIKINSEHGCDLVHNGYLCTTICKSL